MSQFSGKWARLSRQIDGYLGDTVLIVPRLRGEYSEGPPDPDRPARTIKAVFSLRPEVEAAPIDLGRHGGRLQGASKVAIAPATLWIRAAVFAGLGYELRQGDAVTLVELSGRPTYSVSRAVPNDVGDVTVILTDEGE
ncbi:hypothetical protein KQX64_07080 [Rhodopseudomonas palustris]|nr:hypothetical protein KQX64_07080 [Rhodopseudomonas palustris]